MAFLRGGGGVDASHSCGQCAAARADRIPITDYCVRGTTPFDKKRLREAAYDEMRRIIIREEEPPNRSTRL